MSPQSIIDQQYEQISTYRDGLLVLIEYYILKGSFYSIDSHMFIVNFYAELKKCDQHLHKLFLANRSLIKEEKTDIEIDVFTGAEQFLKRRKKN